VAFTVDGDGVGFATESYAASALYTTLASLSGAFWRIRRASPGGRMKIRLFYAIFIVLASSLNPTIAKAQYTIGQCSWVLQQITQSLQDKSFKKTISVERQNLAYCREHMDSDAYESHLDTLASALNDDNQHLEALGVTNRCLQQNSANLSCLNNKAHSLFNLGRLSEAKSISERSLSLGAITEFDVIAKRHLQRLLAQIAADQKERPAASTKPPPSVISVTTRQGVSGRVSCNDTGAVGIAMDINGTIDAATLDNVTKLFEQFHQAEASGGSTNCERTSGNDLSAFGNHFGINSNGGNVVAAMAIGRLLRKENAWLGINGVCISACVLILAGAIDRQIAKDGQVGIHRPYLSTNPQKPLTTDQVKAAYSLMLKELRAYLREMNVSSRLADDMLATEPERVRYLTLVELKDFGLGRVDPAEQQRRAIEKEARDIKEANRMGLDRQEYTRRKALGDSSCAYTGNSGSYTEPLEPGDSVKWTNYSEYVDCKDRILKTGRKD
jgi:ATP-dependent protease ClpP protease subunit